MSRTTLLLWLLLAMAVTLGLTLSYAQSPSPPSTDVLVTVNGTPITELDLFYALRRSRGHRAKATPESREDVLESIILQELIYQKAVDLGLDTDPKYQEEMRRVEVQVNAFKRKKLADAFFRREIANKAEVSNAEAQEYFAANTARIRTEVNVWQILRRKESLVEQDLNDLKHGISFAEIAKKQYPKLPKTGRQPWDLGYLRWNQVPAAWQNVVYDLKKGETSDIIRGPNQRFWIIQLIDKREKPDLTYEDVKPAIMAILRDEKIQQLRDRTQRELRDKARIVYSKRAGITSGGK